MMDRPLIVISICLLTLGLASCQTKDITQNIAPEDDGFIALFDGQTLLGWEGDETWFRVEDGAIVAGSAQRPVTDTVFLNTTRSYYNFELTYELKLLGSRERGNGGVQIRSERVAGTTHVSGYQIDAGQVYWGRIYDESRRRQLLTDLPEDFSIDGDVNHGGWNRYRVIARDGRLRVWLNGIMVSDYTEADAEIAKKTGFIAVQAHAGPPTEIWYRNLRLKPLD